ncbi:MAG: hypothetical protein Q3972_05540 [Corynebacterium sp.]|nr:hypothetical protein [Corynebacterium sp.]
MKIPRAVIMSSVAAGVATSLTLGHLSPVDAETTTNTSQTTTSQTSTTATTSQSTSETTTTTEAADDSLSSGSSEDEKELGQSLVPWLGILFVLWFVGKSYPTPDWFPKIGF